MNKAKVLSAAIAAAMLTSVAAIAVNAETHAFKDGSELEGHKVALIGGFNGWKADQEMTKEGDVYKGTIHVDEVTEDMVGEWMHDKTPTGQTKFQFKVRLDGSWDDSWGDYEPDYDRTNNSQTNCAVDFELGKPLTVEVTFDPTKPSDAAAEAAGGVENIDKSDYYMYWGVTYKVVDESAGDDNAADDNAGDDAADDNTGDDAADDNTGDDAADDNTGDDAADDNTGDDAADDVKDVVKDDKSDDAESPATGDATSAAALAAVVLASLGTAVVMTKKSNKE